MSRQRIWVTVHSKSNMFRTASQQPVSPSSPVITSQSIKDGNDMDRKHMKLSSVRHELQLFRSSSLLIVFTLFVDEGLTSVKFCCCPSERRFIVKHRLNAVNLGGNHLFLNERFRVIVSFYKTPKPSTRQKHETLGNFEILQKSGALFSAPNQKIL